MLVEQSSYYLQEAKRASRTNRGFFYYLEVFDLKEKDLIGKKVLDIGEGDSNFAAVCEERGLAKVFALDAGYANKPPVYTHRKLAGAVQALPFKDGSFDEVISSYLMMWVRKDRARAIKEMLRVTGANGRVLIHPAHPISSAEWNTRRNLSFQVSWIGDGIYYQKTLELIRSEKEPTLEEVAELLTFASVDPGETLYPKLFSMISFIKEDTKIPKEKFLVKELKYVN